MHPWRCCSASLSFILTVNLSVSQASEITWESHHDCAVSDSHNHDSSRAVTSEPENFKMLKLNPSRTPSSYFCTGPAEVEPDPSACIRMIYGEEALRLGRFRL